MKPRLHLSSSLSVKSSSFSLFEDDDLDFSGDACIDINLSEFSAILLNNEKKAIKTNRGSNGGVRHFKHKKYGDVIIKSSEGDTEVLVYQAIGQDHPGIMKWYALGYDGKLSTVYGKGYSDGALNHVMPALQKKLNLTGHSTKKAITLKTVHGYLSQLLRGLQRLHVNNILHHDIKAANILIEGKTAVLCDFNCALFVDENIHDKIGLNTTAAIKSPELFMRKSPLSPEDCKAPDIWALGLVFAKLFQMDDVLSLCFHQETKASFLGDAAHYQLAKAYVFREDKEINRFLDSAETAFIKLDSLSPESAKHFPVDKAMKLVVKTMFLPVVVSKNNKENMSSRPSAEKLVELCGKIKRLYFPDKAKVLTQGSFSFYSKDSKNTKFPKVRSVLRPSFG
jgi:serine/threonine protein kinase